MCVCVSLCAVFPVWNVPKSYKYILPPSLPFCDSDLVIFCLYKVAGVLHLRATVQLAAISCARPPGWRVMALLRPFSQENLPYFICTYCSCFAPHPPLVCCCSLTTLKLSSFLFFFVCFPSSNHSSAAFRWNNMKVKPLVSWTKHSSSLMAAKPDPGMQRFHEALNHKSKRKKMKGEITGAADFFNTFSKEWLRVTLITGRNCSEGWLALSVRGYSPDCFLNNIKIFKKKEIKL